MEDIRIIIMTESSKFSGKCVAGINADSGEWVRLVSNDESMHGAISNEDLICENGRRCEVLDVVKVPVMQQCGDVIQPENVLIDTSRYITIEGKVSISDVLKIHPAEVRRDILGNIYSYITEQKINNVGYSLTFVEVQSLEIHQVETPEGKPKTKANFYYQGEYYQMMSVTDPNFYSVPDGLFYDTAFLVISIGTPYNSRYYKFVSGIFVG